MTIATLAGGSWIFLAFLIIAFFGVAFGYFTVKGSGITPRAYGKVYGGSPGAPRFAGAVLHGNDDPDVPWHRRVVRADGSLAKGERQRRLLEAEGVPFRNERVDMRAAHLPD